MCNKPKFPMSFQTRDGMGISQFAHKVVVFLPMSFYSSEWNGNLPISNLPTNFLLARKFAFIILSIVQFFAHKVFFFFSHEFYSSEWNGNLPISNLPTNFYLPISLDS